ncbi:MULTISPECIES: hypothetical protein [Roseobacteraceae]|uniref:hypothetical protein n=1 Tax=Roseobacteraceae TaxID=2854170 RepID=UPI00080ABDF0|nr:MULTISPECIES: hypothetical protein [Roseobacteraceae]ANT58892.1 hypothetical protein AYJ57_00060 [Salipiger sp. CCB-MM3]MCA0994607.1 hypothetical protein [Alloyangia pacifica]NDV99623.1 hypothetical protein [Salipiger sp. PrR002]NDW57269.1 hypothetical protein [Salipiger sp. PrR004]
MAHHHRFYRRAREFGALKAVALVGLLVLTQALASIQTHHAAEEAAIETVHVPQLLPAMFGEAEDAVAKIGKLI